MPLNTLMVRERFCSILCALVAGLLKYYTCCPLPAECTNAYHIDGGDHCGVHHSPKHFRNVKRVFTVPKAFCVQSFSGGVAFGESK